MKRETTLSVLKEIRDLLKAQNPPTVNVVEETKTDVLRVKFPKMNLKEIFEQSGGKTINGYPLVWNFKDSWLRDEKFFTEEYTREG